jgi:hypothetical protein
VDAVLDVLQALGIGIALGMIAAASGRATSFAVIMGLVLGAIGGFIWAGADDASVPADLIAGAIGGFIAATIVGSVVAGARKRGGDDSGSVAVFITLAAVVVAVLSILFGLLALIPLGALLLLASARRRRAQRKHEGLRILR